MTVTRKYKFPTLAAYFDDQKKRQTVGGNLWGPSDVDTYGKMAERHDVAKTTIFRIATGLTDPSYALALAISNEVGVALDGMGKSGLKRAV